MKFYANIGYKFAVATTANPDGCILRASAMPQHQLVRRKFGKDQAFFENRLFDPQLYLSGLQHSTSPKTCVYLATYPWFKTKNLPGYDSGQISQAGWKENVTKNIAKIWTGKLFDTATEIELAVKQCIDFQILIGCEHIILPCPLTHEPGTDYTVELQWLDCGIRYAKEEIKTDKKIYASLPISDLCLRFFTPKRNATIDLIADNVGARGELDGVYIVIEQASETAESRQCSDINTLQSLLHITRIFSNDCKLDVIVNFVGHFGLACIAAGANTWASNWYKSDYRLRLADSIAAGRAYPSYWSTKSMADTHLENDFDELVSISQFPAIEEVTTAGNPLNQAAKRRVKVDQVPAWKYSQSNVTACIDHFVESCCLWNKGLKEQSDKVLFIRNLLGSASTNRSMMDASLSSKKTRNLHVDSWKEAFIQFCKDHNL